MSGLIKQLQRHLHGNLMPIKLDQWEEKLDDLHQPIRVLYFQNSVAMLLWNLFMTLTPHSEFHFVCFCSSLDRFCHFLAFSFSLFTSLLCAKIVTLKFKKRILGKNSKGCTISRYCFVSLFDLLLRWKEKYVFGPVTRASLWSLFITNIFQHSSLL